MLAVAKHQRYVSNYSGLLLPIYYNWEVAMGESNTSSPAALVIYMYISSIQVWIQDIQKIQISRN